MSPGKRYPDWRLTDPAGKDVEQVRPIRDEIDRRVRALLAELAPAAGPSRPARSPLGAARGLPHSRTS